MRLCSPPSLGGDGLRAQLPRKSRAMAPRSEGKRGSSGRERDAERKKRRKHREADDGDSDLVWVEKATEAPAVQVSDTAASLELL